MRRGTLILIPIVLALIAGSRSTAQPNLLPVQNGYLIMTCFSGDYNTGQVPGNPVCALVNVSNPPGPFNTNWLAPAYHGEYAPQKWTAGQMGEVFGSCFDASGNIYLTATTVYGAYPFGPGGPGGVYKINGVSGAISVFASLPNTGPALGNISSDPTFNQIFVTNFEDGKIYRLSSAGTVLSTFDPFAPDGGTVGFAPRGERLWGIRVYGNRVYYSVWWEDGGNANPSKANEIWSVGLNGSGDFVPTDNTKELDVPVLRVYNYSNPVSDIAFSIDGKRMLLAERTMYGDIQASLGGWAHASRLLEFSGTHLSWTGYPVNKYRHGVIMPDSSNVSGGGDYGYEALTPNGKDDCDSVVWATADAIHFGTPDIIYGLQGTPSTGGTIVNSILIDADGVTNQSDKTQIGDVTSFRTCKLQGGGGNPCDSIRVTFKPVPPDPTGQGGQCCWNVTVTNQMAGYWSSVQGQVITTGASFASVSSPVGWTNTLGGVLCSWSPTSGTIPVGTRDSLMFCLNLAPGTATPQKVVITLVGHGVVCRDTLTVDCKPPVDNKCVFLEGLRANCGSMTPSGQSYNLSFLLQNQTIYTMVGANLSPIGNFTMTPSTLTFSPALAPNAIGGPYNIIVSGPDAQGGKTICFEVTIHDNGYRHCCTDTFCITLPVCKDCCTGFRIAQGQQVGIKYNTAGQVGLSTSFTAGPMPIIAASATVVSATISQGCQGFKPVGSVSANIINANAFAGLPGPSFSVPPIAPNMSREVKWGTNPTGVSVVNKPMNLLIQFPPPPNTPKCSDTVRFCIRYRFTDTSCRTCDTLICYQIIRRGKLVIGTPIGSSLAAGVPKAKDVSDDERGRAEKEPTAHLQSLASDGAEATIKMTNGTDGMLTFHVAPADGGGPSDALTVIALEIEPMPGVGPVTASDGASTYPSVDNRARVPVTIAQGASKQIGLKFTNGVDAIAWWNDIRVYYTYADSPADTNIGYMRVTARTPAGMGGDTLVLDPNAGAKRKDVRTYALKFTSNNPTADSIASVTISVKSPVRILAVGPTVDSTTTTLGFRADGKSAVLLDVDVDSDGAYTSVRLPKGADYGPIYLTVAGAESDTLAFDYETHDGDGGIVTKGDVKIDHPITSAVRLEDGGDGAATVALIGSRPNPARESATISFVLFNAEPTVWLDVHDITGRVVARLVQGDRMETGAHEVELSTLGLVSGTYYYTLRTASGSQTRAMTVVR